MSYPHPTAYDVAADDYWLEHGCNCAYLPWRHIETPQCEEFKDVADAPTSLQNNT